MVYIGQFFLIAESGPTFLATLFVRMDYVLFSTKKTGLGNILGNFFSQTHPVTLQPDCRK
jgi:hypothetical protein